MRAPAARRLLSLLTSAAYLASLLAVSNANGAEPAANPSQEAESAFQQGRDSAKNGDYRAACEQFRASLQAEPATGTRINLGDCEERLGHWVRAIENFRAAIRELARDDERLPLLAQRVAVLENQVPHLTLRTRAALPGGTRVFLDDNEILPAAIGAQMPIDPGVHHVRVIRPDHPDRLAEVTISAKQIMDVTLDGPSDASQVPASTPVEAKTSNAAPTWGWIALGAGAASLAVGTTAGIMALHSNAIVGRECNAAHECSPAGLSAIDDRALYATASTVGFVAGVAGVGIGAYLLLWRSKSVTVVSDVTRGSLLLRGQF